MTAPSQTSTSTLKKKNKKTTTLVKLTPETKALLRPFPKRQEKKKVQNFLVTFNQNQLPRAPLRFTTYSTRFPSTEIPTVGSLLRDTLTALTAINPEALRRLGWFPNVSWRVCRDLATDYFRLLDTLVQLDSNHQPLPSNPEPYYQVHRLP